MGGSVLASKTFIFTVVRYCTSATGSWSLSLLYERTVNVAFFIEPVIVHEVPCLAIEDDEPLRPFTDHCDSVRTFSEKTTEWTPIFLHLPSGIAAHFTRPRRSAQGQPCSSTKTLSTCRTMRAAVAKTRGTRSAWGGLHEGKKKEKKRNFFFLHLWNKCQRALWHIFVSFSPRCERFNMWSFFSREDGWRMNARRPSLSLVAPAGVDTSRSFSCGIACARRGIWEAGAVEGAETFFLFFFFDVSF